MKEILEKDISILRLEKNTTKNLLSNNIDNVLKLCNYSRIELSELNFTNEQINEIIIGLQLIGLDLKKNHAKRNTVLDGLI
jgi:hypothetical protein